MAGFYSGLGKWLRDKRESAGLTQQNVADTTRLQRKRISRMEHGATMDVAEFINLAMTCGLDPVEAMEEVMLQLGDRAKC